MGAFLAPGITDGTPLSTAHDYKAKRGGGGNTTMWDNKKSQKATRDTLGLELKNAPTITFIKKLIFLLTCLLNF